MQDKDYEREWLVDQPTKEAEKSDAPLSEALEAALAKSAASDDEYTQAHAEIDAEEALAKKAAEKGDK